MSKTSFKVNKSLELQPVDLTTIISPKPNELALDINDSNKLKRYNSSSSTWVDVQTASSITNVPAGSLSDTTVQSAINSLNSNTTTVANNLTTTNTNLSNHTGASAGVHGVTGSVVGTTDTQTLTNKTINATNNTITNLTDSAISSTAAIARSKLAAGVTNVLVANNSSGVLGDITDISVNLNTFTLANSKHLELQSQDDSTTTGTNAQLAAFTAGGIRLTNTSLVSLSNIPAGNAGQEVAIFNRTGVTVTVKDSSDGIGTTANRILTGTNADIQFPNNAALLLSYDSVTARWQIVGGSGGTSSSSFLDSTFAIQNSVDTTKQLVVSLTGASTATKTTLAASQTLNRTLTLPDITDTLAALTATQTFTNKSMSGSANTFTNIPLTSAVTGILPVLNGGTGVSAVPTTATASSFAAWDANKNIPTNNAIEGFTSTATAAGITTLTVASTYAQAFTGTTTQTVVLPVATTLVNGFQFLITNLSTGTVTIQSSGLNTVATLATNTQAIVTCINTAGGTGTASWSYTYSSVQSNSLGGGGFTNPMTTAGDLIIGGSSGTATRLPAGTSGQVLKTVAGVPTWVTPDESLILAQYFDYAQVSDFTQTGLSLSTNNPINGTKSALLTSNASTTQSFKQIFPVATEYRNKNATFNLDIRSSATQGNVTILFHDETNNADIGTSQQITTGSQSISVTTTSGAATLAALSTSVYNSLSIGMSITGAGIPAGTVISAMNLSTLVVTMSQNATASATVTTRVSALPAEANFSFNIPANCSSLSYTISALAEANNPETYIDDINLQLTASALSTTSITTTTFNSTDWTAYTPTFTGFGTPTSVNFFYKRVGDGIIISGTFTSGTSTAVQAQVTLPSGVVTSGVISSNSLVGSFGLNSVNTYFGTILGQPSVSYLNFSYQSSGTTGTTPQNATAFIGSGQTLTFTTEPIPVSGWTSNITTSTTIPLTTAQLVQQSDSAIKIGGYLGLGSTNTTVVRWNNANINQNIGSDIKYISDAVNGDSFTALTSGSYTVNANLTSQVSDSGVRAITINSNALTSIPTDPYILDQINANTPGTTRVGMKLSWTGYLNAGDVIRVQTTTASYNTTIDNFSMAKQGSLKQLNPSSDSKIVIPTHQLRFEGASARGSTATAIVQFSTQTITQGDAWTVTNDSVNGTVVMMKKAGKLSVQTSLLFSGNQDVFISKNQSSALTATPSNSSEIMARATMIATDRGSIANTFDVNIGDVIRVAASGTPTSDVGNNLTLSLQETSIPANFSNVLPQWSQSDSCIQLRTANGYGSTNTKIRRFSNLVQSIGGDVTYTDDAALGGYFTINTSGTYNISYSDGFNTADYFGVTKNTTQPTVGIGSLTNQSEVLVVGTTPQTNYLETVSTPVYLVAGDVIRAHANGDASGTGPEAKFTISKVGKPSLTSVDVTPFVNMKTTDTEYIEALTATTTFGSTNTGVPVLNITRNSNLGVIQIVSDSVNGTSFKALKDCELKMSAMGYASGNGNTLALTKNATSLLTASFNNDFAFASGYTVDPQASVSGSVKLIAGDVVRVQTAGAYTLNRVTLTATADNNATASPVQQVSSDTMSFVFKSTAIAVTDPIGTFNTYTIAATGATWTLATTAPTQTTSSMNTNGIQLFARAYNAASTSASPARVDIFIGTGLKSNSVNAYASTAKTTPLYIDWAIASTVSELGTRISYNEVTGILTLDAGTAYVANTTRNLGMDSATNFYTSGYFVINASKSPSIAALPILSPRIAYLSEQQASGTNGGSSVASTWTTRTLNTLVDSTGIITSLSSNQFTLPAGTYRISGNSSLYQTTAADVKIRIRNITDSTTSVIGQSALIGTSSGGMIALDGEITITSAKTFALQYYTSSATATVGLGQGTGSGDPELWSQIAIQKIK